MYQEYVPARVVLVENWWAVWYDNYAVDNYNVLYRIKKGISFIDKR